MEEPICRGFAGCQVPDYSMEGLVWVLNTVPHIASFLDKVELDLRRLQSSHNVFLHVGLIRQYNDRLSVDRLSKSIHHFGLPRSLRICSTASGSGLRARSGSSQSF